MRITYPLARTLASVAEREALDLGVPMAIAVTDEVGGTLYFGRMDGALPAASEIAVGKAYTASALRMPTEDVGRLAQPNGELYGIQHTHGGKIILFGGGLPLRLGGKVAGGIGISGGSVEQDMRVAEPVVSALEQMEALGRALGKVLPHDAAPPHSVERMVSQVQAKWLGHAAPKQDLDSIALITGALYLLWSDGG